MLCNVNLVTGELLEQASDFWLPGWIPLDFSRLYKSFNSARGMLGVGWSHTYDALLRVEKERIVYRDAVGAEQPFLKAQNYVSGQTRLLQAGEFLVLSAPGSNRQLFAPRGAGANIYSLVAVEDEYGNALRFFYQSGRLAEILDSIGRRLL